MSNLTIQQRRELVAQKILQLDREVYMNQLNEKIMIATQAPSEQLDFIREEIRKANTALSVLEEEMATLQ